MRLPRWLPILLVAFAPPASSEPCRSLIGTDPLSAPTRAHRTAAIADNPAPGDLVINEFNYAAFGADVEYVEVYNRSARSFDLNVLALADERRRPTRITDASHFVAPDGYVVLVRDAAAFGAQFPDVEVVEVAGWPALNNDGDELALLYDTLVIDAVTFAPTWGGADAALERLDPDRPSHLAANWQPSHAATGGTPGARNSVYEPDDASPRLLAVGSNTTGDTLHATFSEPLFPESVQRTDFVVGGPSTVSVSSLSVHDASVQLTLNVPLQPGGYTLTVTHVADFSGNVLARDQADFVYFQGAEPTSSDIVINEIHYDPLTAGEPEEYVELFNQSLKTFDVRDLTFSDEEGRAVPLSEEPMPLRPGAFVVLVRDVEAFTDLFGPMDVLDIHPWPSLNNGGDVAMLRYEAEVIDAVAYDGRWGEVGRALERIDPAGPSGDASNWAPSSAPEGGTPAAVNAAYAPDHVAPSLIFAEGLDPKRVLVVFDEPIDAGTLTAHAFSAGGLRPTYVERMTSATEAVLVFDRPVTARNLSVVGIADARGNVQEHASVPLARRPSDNDLVVNEIMYAPPTDSSAGRPPAPEYVELMNRSDHLISLRGLYLTTSSGRADTLSVGASPLALQPAGYAVIFADPDDADHPGGRSRLERAFPEIDFDQTSIVLLPHPRSDLGLANDGETIRLHMAGGTVLDAVPYDPAWHTPDLVDARGVALERIDASGHADEPTNWSSSAALAGGTPGERNAVSVDAATPPTVAGLTVTPSPFSPDGDGFEDVASIAYTLHHAPATIRVRVFDQMGRLVRTLTPARLAGASGRLSWDGRDDDGHRLRIGIYVVVLDAVAARAGETEAHRKTVVLARRL